MMLVTDDEIMNALRSHIKEHGYPPTMRELADEVGLQSSSSIFKRLDSLVAKGFIERDPMKPRTIKVLK